MKLEHIGIAIRNSADSEKIFADLLGADSYKSENVESEGVKTTFFNVGESKIELLQALDPQSPVAKFIEKRGEGIHHLAFEVEDIDFELNRLEELGYQLIHRTPKDGADNKRIAFLHPKSTNGVLIELCQEKT
ncbi:MAG: methylmalonyl-CoA epimerase [Crocinitomicaceae bacterium]|mgnify:FL=1|nr:methylmalonyl-CoA epimerase [Crocinitomicaceae bacterium]MBT6515461.1 methylmalonyl-CoA epimerase [Crocinitomicaceae bacterium]